jgi:hypothetical protein
MSIRHFFEANVSALFTSTQPHSLFQSEKAAKHELLTCDGKFFCRRQWIGHGRLAPQVRHKRSVLFAIDRAAARGGENSICQRPFPK